MNTATSRNLAGINSPTFVRRLVARNNDRIASHDLGSTPRHALAADVTSELRDALPRIREEWDDFVGDGGVLPRTEDLFQGWQGNVGSWWRSGILILRGDVSGPLARRFPWTTRTFSCVPGLLSLMWSVMGPGAELPEHRGDNAGGLRLLYGVVCPEGSGHDLEGTPTPVVEGEALLFDDTHLHSAWNRSDRPRVLLLGDVLRPLPYPLRWQNAAVQLARHHMSARYRRAASLGKEWHQALNPAG